MEKLPTGTEPAHPGSWFLLAVYPESQSAFRRLRGVTPMHSACKCSPALFNAPCKRRGQHWEVRNGICVSQLEYIL